MRGRPAATTIIQTASPTTSAMIQVTATAYNFSYDAGSSYSLHSTMIQVLTTAFTQQRCKVAAIHLAMIQVAATASLSYYTGSSNSLHLA